MSPHQPTRAQRGSQRVWQRWEGCEVGAAAQLADAQQRKALVGAVLAGVLLGGAGKTAALAGSERECFGGALGRKSRVARVAGGSQKAATTAAMANAWEEHRWAGGPCLQNGQQALYGGVDVGLARRRAEHGKALRRRVLRALAGLGLCVLAAGAQGGNMPS